MERREAAEFLGVSLSTLDRLASQGRLTKGRGRRRTKPVTVFDPKELEALKAELANRRTVAVSPAQRDLKPQDAIGFRLDPFYVRRLAEEGGKNGLSPGEYARRLVVRALEDTPADRFREEVHALREGLADTFHAFLTMKCGVSEDDATEFVRDTILKEPDRC